MKVLHITNALGPLNSGGIGDVLTAFVKKQNTLLNNVEVWHPNDISDSEEFSKETGLKFENIHSFKNIGSNKIGFSPMMIYKAFQHRKSFDIIHQHGIWLPISLSSLIISSKKTKKVISPHGFLNEIALSISPKRKRLSAFLFENKNLQSADCLHACSSFEADFFRSFRLKQDIAIIPNGVDNHFLHAAGQPELFKHKYDLEGKRVLLFLSRIHPSKGLMLLFDIIASIKDDFKNWNLVIAGIDELNHTRDLKALAKRLEIESFLTFTGPIFGQEKINAFDASEVFILPTATENFGIVIAQALARKKPVITTTNAPWKDLEDYDCGWWIQKQKNIFQDTLKEVLSLSSDQLNHKGRNGFSLIQNNYMWETLSQQTIELYEFLLNKNKTKPSFIV